MATCIIIDDDFTIDVLEDAEAISEIETLQEPNPLLFLHSTIADVAKPCSLLEDFVLYHCDICPFTTKSQLIFSNHKKSHYIPDEGLRSACICGLVVLRKHINSHMLNCSAVKKRRHKCTQCSFETFKRRSLTLHLARHEKGFSCKSCCYIATSKTTFDQHVAKHSNGIFKCDECNFSAWRKVNLDVHKQRHHLAHKFACNKCDFATHSKKQIGKHIKTHTGTVK